MKRTFYFLKDSVTNKFYTGESNCLSEFTDGAVYYQEKNAQKKIKDLVRSWERQLEYADYWIDYVKKSTPKEKQWAKDNKENALARKGLPLWGILIVSYEIHL